MTFRKGWRPDGGLNSNLPCGAADSGPTVCQEAYRALARRDTMTTVLVTGGLGVIGSRLVPHLRQHGHDVKVMDNRIAKLPDYIRADICSTVEVMQAFK